MFASACYDKPSFASDFCIGKGQRVQWAALDADILNFANA
jgi:hypothetical protein